MKKRKLSSDGSEPESSYSSRKDSLNEGFSALSIEGKHEKAPLATSPASTADTPNSTNGDYVMKIPKPLKFGQSLTSSAIHQTQSDLPNHYYKKDEFLENLIQISKNDVAGISKYLNLDLNSKLISLDRTLNQEGDTKKSSSSIITSFFSSPFSTTLAAFMNPLLQVSNKMDIEDSQSSFNSSIKPKLNSMDQSLFVGPLTREERMKKIQTYLEKKKNRRSKNIRYTIRKDLADKRERIQGRFVKTKKYSFQMDDIKVEPKNDIKMEESSTSSNSALKQQREMNFDLLVSDFARNNLSDSYSHLRKSGMANKS